jgi:hypothetical protein
MLNEPRAAASNLQFNVETTAFILLTVVGYVPALDQILLGANFIQGAPIELDCPCVHMVRLSRWIRLGVCDDAPSATQKNCHHGTALNIINVFSTSVPSQMVL